MAGSQAALLQRAFDVVDCLSVIDAPQDILDSTAPLFRQMGFSALMMTRLPEGQSELGAQILINGWPDAWFRQYTEARHYDDDPLRRHCMNSAGIFSWSEIPKALIDTKRASDVLGDACAFGFKAGICLPLHTAFGKGGLSLAGEHVEDTPITRTIVRLLGFYIAAATERHSDRGAKPLSARERDILSFIAAGKTAPQIAEILRISEYTVGDHLKHIRAKLGTSNNAHSVAVALRTGQLTP